MQHNKQRIIILLVGLLWGWMGLEARPGSSRVVWTQQANSGTGLYSTRNYFVAHGVSLNASCLYYYGDADNEGIAFNGGFNIKNLSLGGGLQFSYNMPVGNCCNMRFGLMGGTLQGNNKEKFDELPQPRDDYRSFHSYLVQPSVGVEYYPFTKAGLYLYAGFGFTISIIDQYQYYHSMTINNEKKYVTLEGSSYGFLPMAQLGFGYSWSLAESWVLSLEVMGQQGLVDAHYMNLDAYPMAAGQNKYGVEKGGITGTWTDREGKKHLYWTDGWFQVGLTISYRWRNCEYCRNSQIYGNMKIRHNRR